MDKKIINILKKGGIGVLLTDTLYGLVGQALSKDAVKRIFELKKRDPKKPLIVLISSINDLKKVGITINKQLENKLNEYWPGRVSVILPLKKSKFNYLHRGTDTLCVRMPNKKSLIELIKKVGPLVAPSANAESKPPAKNITEAKKYFGNEVDFYLKGARPKSKPSTIIKIVENEVIVLR